MCDTIFEHEAEPMCFGRRGVFESISKYRKRFGTTLSFSEADPERLRRTLHMPSPRAMLTIAVCVTLIIIFAILLMT